MAAPQTVPIVGELTVQGFVGRSRLLPSALHLPDGRLSYGRSTASKRGPDSRPDSARSSGVLAPPATTTPGNANGEKYVLSVLRMRCAPLRSVKLRDLPVADPAVVGEVTTRASTTVTGLKAGTKVLFRYRAQVKGVWGSGAIRWGSSCSRGRAGSTSVGPVKDEPSQLDRRASLGEIERVSATRPGDEPRRRRPRMCWQIRALVLDDRLVRGEGPWQAGSRHGEILAREERRTRRPVPSGRGGIRPWLRRRSAGAPRRARAHRRGVRSSVPPARVTMPRSGSPLRRPRSSSGARSCCGGIPRLCFLFAMRSSSARGNAHRSRGTRRIVERGAPGTTVRGRPRRRRM
jgi:hypothetical protein